MAKINHTHGKDSESLEKAKKALEKKIQKRGDLSHVTIERQLEIIEELSSFPLGRFFLERKGADGYWTDYIINYPNTPLPSGELPEKDNLCFIEDFILNRCPLTLATRERFKIFQKEIQLFAHEKMTFASIPCGVMRDLLGLDYSKYSSFSLIGVDLDSTSLGHAKNLARKQGILEKVQFIQEDAWHLDLDGKIELITSNGLNVYIPDPVKVLALYKKFYELLKDGGKLIAGVLTNPPYDSTLSEWNSGLLSEEDILMERILFQDILGSKWRNFRSLNEMIQDFYTAGFSNVEILADKYNIFPTVIAEK